MKKARILLVTLATLAVVVGLSVGAYWGIKRFRKVDHPPVAAEVLVDAAPLLAGLPLADLNRQVQQGSLDGARAHVALYASGRRLNDAWAVANDAAGAWALAYQKAKEKLQGQPQVAVLSLAYDQELVNSKNQKSKLSNVHRGVFGLMVRPKDGDSDGSATMKSPTNFVATNRDLRGQLEVIAKDQKTDTTNLIAERRVYLLKARQFHVDLAAGKPAQEMLRGNVLIRPQEVTVERLQAFARRMSEWMLKNVQPDGRMVYLYWPSRGEEAKTNNSIRQMMATICLGRVAKGGEIPEAQEIADRNLRYNLQKFYREHEGLGSIELDGSSKLGAIALALIAIIESPLRKELAQQEAALLRTIEHLWQPSGRFRTFLFPKERDDNHNFYPGEALLSLSIVLAETKNPELEQKILTSARHYKEWHLANRNPAFVPWHTQAYYTVWQLQPHAELKDWVFEMNDWLLGMQERSMVVYEDTLGRFYDPKHPDYGPPHASSTGVYLEGLIDAFALARKVGDEERVQRYRRSILLGLRDALQLEFADDIDLFYISKPDRVRGGLRTTVYDNQIRVDNVQHVLMGLQKILREFQPADYAPVQQ